LIADAIEVTRYLLDRFRREQVMLMGHSFGSYLGVQIAAAAPELFSAYVGISQFVASTPESDTIEYRLLRAELESRASRLGVRLLEASVDRSLPGQLQLRDDCQGPLVSARRRS
jgi:pimeloyl-ACP methyl ester carboxylesterase